MIPKLNASALLAVGVLALAANAPMAANDVAVVVKIGGHPC